MQKPNLTILSPVAKTRHQLNQRFIQAAGAMFNTTLVECFGYSEVARARCHVASNGAKVIEESGGLVLWLDSDMVLVSPLTLAQHYKIVEDTRLSVSGRYVTRQNAAKVAAARDEFEKREPFTTSVVGLNPESTSVAFSPVLSGMGVLMMTAPAFLEQYESSPRDPQGGRIVCCPYVMPYRDGASVMVSEDFDYCQRIGGAWFVEFEAAGEKHFLDYGHISEKVLIHEPKPHTLTSSK